MTERTYRTHLGRRLGSIIFRLRSAKRWTRYDLARRAGISENYVRALEQGRNNATVQILLDLAEVLGTTAWEMVREATEGVKPAPAPQPPPPQAPEPPPAPEIPQPPSPPEIPPAPV